MRLRNPLPLGVLHGPGIVPACANFLELELEAVSEISFQSLSEDCQIAIGYIDMDADTGEGVLRVLLNAGESFEVRLDSGARDLILGNFAAYLPSEKDRVLVAARF